MEKEKKTDFPFNFYIVTFRVSGEKKTPALGAISILNHKNYNFLDCDWFKKLLFPTNSLVKLLSDSLLSDTFFIGQFVIGQFNNPITFKVVVKINQSHLKLYFKSTNHNLGFNHHRNKCTNS